MPGIDGFQLCQRVRQEPSLVQVPIVLWSAHHQDEVDHVLALRVGASALLSRSGDFKEVVGAILATIDPGHSAQQAAAPLPGLGGDAGPAVEQPAIGLAEQLTRQAAAHASLARRCALHAAQLAIIGGVADALSRSQDVDAVLDDILAACLDAGGITRGALYRIGAGGRLAVEQAVGFAETDIPALESCFGHPGLLDEVKMVQTILPSRFLRDTELRTLLTTTRATALVIVPLAIADQCTGALLLASDLADIGEEDLLAFGRAIGAYINQALGLAAAFQRVEAAAEAQRELFSCVDIDDTLRAITRLGTRLGDVCQVDLIRDGEVVQSETAFLHPDRTALRLEHELTLPLEAHGMQLAMMHLFRRAAPYGRADRQAAEQLARTASVALHKAHLYRQAQAANQAKDDFLATMSHELRTPLTAVLLWTDKLRRRTSDPTVMAHGLTVIHDNAKLQANLIDDILDVSRVVTGKLVLRIEQVDLESVIASAVEIITPSADARAITIETAFDPGASMIAGDPQRLQQVVLNLLSNAVKFTPRGGKITITVTRVTSCIELRVIDTGKGVDPAFLPFVFDQFRQADPSSTRAHGGLGLGLALVKSLVELHGGKVRAESAGVDHGATFVVRLPVPAVRDYGLRKAGEQAAQAPGPLRVDSDRLKGLRLLVVDDESEVRELIADLLAEFGAQVRAVASVKDALRAFAEFKPNLLITDLGMPTEDGYELIRQVRLTSTVPAVALTAYVGEEDRQRVLASGFQVHLRKPVRPEVLLETITGLAARPAQGGVQ